MIPLPCTKFPDSKGDLSDALDQALHRYVAKDDRIVTVSARVFPYLDEIAINLDGAQVNGVPPTPTPPAGETKPACEAAVLSVSARKMAIQGAPLNLQLEARDLIFHQGQDAEGNVLLVLNGLRTGHVTVSASQLDLENAIAKIAEQEARKNGITIEQTRVSFRARGPRSVSVDVSLNARKLLFRARIDISGQLAIGDDFTAKISNLKCRGEGAVGSLACGVLDPHLRQLEGRTFSLMSLPLGEIQLRDVRITVADTLELTADFGTPA